MDDGDKKPPARRSPPARGNDEGIHQQHKRRRDDSGGAIIGGGDMYDVAEKLDFRPGERIEVKWTILDRDDDEGGEDAAVGGPAEADAKETEALTAAAVAVDDGGGDDDDDGSAASGNGITVWWEATLVRKTDRVHDLVTDKEVGGGTGGCSGAIASSTSVRMPIYELDYAPLEEYGFDSHSVEDVAFISDTTLLNLSTDEVMKFRKAGMLSPPSSPERDAVDVDVSEEHDDISREFHGEDDMMSFMNRMMSRVMKSTGMDQKMKGLPASQQLYMAERIRKAKEGMLDSIMEETNRMGNGKKIVTEEVVRRCMEKMKGAY